MSQRVNVAMFLDDVEEYAVRVSKKFADDVRTDDGAYVRYLRVNVNYLPNKASNMGLDFSGRLASEAMEICKRAWSDALVKRGFVNVECKDCPNELTAIAIRYERPWRR